MNNHRKLEGHSGDLTWFSAVLLSALVAGCGNDGGQDPNLGTVDVPMVVPTVTAVTPNPNATGVPVNTKLITVTFSAAMDPATITAASFTLACPAGTPVAGTVTYLDAAHAATLSIPVATDLAPNTTCIATVTTAARDARTGSRLGDNFFLTFTTGAALDTTAPTVTGTIDANGATGASTNTKVGATFSEAMDPSTITTSTLTLKQGTTVIAGTVSYSGMSAVFAPVNTLAGNTSYTATVTTGAKDLAGNAIASDHVWSWTTGAAPDTTPPAVTGASPANGAADAAINTKVAAKFNEEMDPSTITSENFTLKETATNARIAGTTSYSGMSAVFNPANNLANSAKYTVTVKGGANGVKDLAGNPMVSDFVIGWTTAAAPDTTAPTVTSTVDANGATNVPINTSIGATFSEAMDPLTITNATFTVKQTVSGNFVAGTPTYSGVSAFFTPTGGLASDTAYTVSIRGGVNGVRDLAGNALASDYVWTLTTAALTAVAPSVDFINPRTNAFDVPINRKTITVVFTKPMDPATLLAAGSFTLACPAGTPVIGVVTYLAASNLAALTFPAATSLPPNTVCTAVLTTAVKDTTGVPLNNQVAWGFMTGATSDTTPPAVIGAIIANGATNVAISTNVGATFSEPMDPTTITSQSFALKETATGTLVDGNVIYYTGVSALFIPASSLASGTAYTATIKGGANGVKDLAGNALASDYVSTWTTGGDFDTTPPTTTAGPSVSGITDTSATLSATINENGTGYYLISYARWAPPSIESVLTYGGPFAMSANVPATVAITGLSGVPLLNSYRLYFVAKDASNNVQPALQSADFSTIPKTTPPTTTAGPSVSGTTATSTILSVTIDENGGGYYLVQPAAAAAPSVATVQNSGSAFGMSANIAASVPITGLTASTAYRIYFVARNWNLKMQDAVQSVAFSTAPG